MVIKEIGVAVGLKGRVKSQVDEPRWRRIFQSLVSKNFRFYLYFGFKHIYRMFNVLFFIYMFLFYYMVN